MNNKLDTAFDNYLKSFNMNEKLINFRYRHSYRVKELMKELALKLNLSSKEIEVSEVIGLLHDIGRFEQITKHGTCSDIKTGVDHADQSCIYLFDEGHIKDFYDDQKYYPIIEDAIRYHNKYKIDDNIKDKSLLFSKMIRDMDKVDIYRVISDEYTLTYDKNEITDKILEYFNNKKQARTTDRKTKTDIIYCHLSFLYDINFIESFEMLKNSNNLEKYFSKICSKEDSIDKLNSLKESIISYINLKIETNK